MDQSSILPDSRLHEARGVVRINTGAFGPFGPVNAVPIFCANCGARGGYVPEENCTFACYLCEPCADKWGEIADVLFMPDEVFWQRVAEEQVERYGHLLSIEELERVVNSSHPLATLLRESPLKGG